MNNELLKLPPEKYVNGRRAILQMLDSLLAEDGNIKTMREAFQILLDAKPLTFFHEIILPLMPKDMLGLSPDDDARNNDTHLMIEFKPAPVSTILTKEPNEV